MMSLKLTTTVFFLTAAFEVSFIDAARPDYIYIKSRQASYKFHSQKATWTVATDICRSEGSWLFHPDDQSELDEVLRALAFIPNFEWLRTGLSDLATYEDYRTIDGRPVSEVYSKWTGGKPNSRSDYRCTYLRVNPSSHELILYLCDDVSWPFVCKARYVDPVATAIEYAKAFANASDKQTSIVERLADAAANQASDSNRMAANLAAVLERIAESDANQSVAMQQMTATIGLQAANQTAASDRLMTGMAAAIERQTAAIGQLAASQAAALDRMTVNLAAALEQIAGPHANQQQMTGLQAANQAADTQQLTEAIGHHAANLSTAMERQTAAIGLQTANQTAASDSLMTSMVAAMQRLTTATEMQAANQTASIQQLIAAIGLQAASQAAAMQQLTAAIGLQAANQTIAIERQAQALEKLASQGENSQ